MQQSTYGRQPVYEDEAPDLDIHLTLDFPEQIYDGCQDRVRVRQQHNGLLYSLFVKHNIAPGRLIKDEAVDEMLKLRYRNPVVPHNRQNRTGEINKKLKQACPDSLEIKHVRNGITSGYIPMQYRPIRILSDRATSNYSGASAPRRATILFPPGKPWWHWIIGR